MDTMALDVFEAASGRLAALKARHNLLVQATKEVLVEGLDFGKIPGTGDKPTLLKPGAEKLCYLFGLRPTFDVVEAREDWTGGLFYYRYRCTLHDQSGNVLADGEGSCNSREKKYRYRQSERVCPKCGKPTIIKGKDEYGGGWLCYAKKGGCGAKFADNAPEITSQPSGLVENTEPYDLVNTIQKMAQKRALVAAVLVGAGASQFFTQDVEDMSIIDVPFEVTKHVPAQVVEADVIEEAPAAEPVQEQEQAAEPSASMTMADARSYYSAALNAAKRAGRSVKVTSMEGLTIEQIIRAADALEQQSQPGRCEPAGRKEQERWHRHSTRIRFQSTARASPPRRAQSQRKSRRCAASSAWRACWETYLCWRQRR